MVTLDWGKIRIRFPSSALYPFFGEGSPTKIDYRKKVGTLLLTSLLEDLEENASHLTRPAFGTHSPKRRSGAAHSRRPHPQLGSDSGRHRHG